MTQEVTLEATETTENTQDQVVETTEAETEADSQTDAPEVESEEVELTAEEKLERLQKDLEAKERKISRQTAAYNRAQETLQARARELEALQSQMAQFNQPESNEPNIDDFETHEEYDAARIKYLADQEISKREKELNQKRQNELIAQQMRERESIRAKQEAEYIALNPNYKNSKAEFEDFVSTMQVNPDIEKAIVEQAFAGNIPQVIDYFGSNGGERLAELERISKMTPREAIIAIYEIQKGFKSPEKKETKPLPKPVTKLKATSSTSRPVSKMSGKDLLKQMGVSGY